MDVTHTALPNAEPLPTPSGHQATETRAKLLLSLAVVASLAAVAYTDWRVEPHVNLGYLYVLPLSLSALIHPRRVSLAFVGGCVILHDLFGPFDYLSFWQLAVRNLMTLVAFSSVVIMLHRLGQQRLVLAEIVRRQRDALSEELQHAAQVQRHLLPQQARVLPGYDLAGLMRPANLVGGDYYDYIGLPGGDLGVVIADVAGKGAPAALLMASVKTALGVMAGDGASPQDTLRKLNLIACDLTRQERFISLFYARLYIQEHQLEYSNGGHFPPLLYRSTAGEVVWLESSGPVLGLLPAAEYESARIQLLPGDVLVLYTDGALEARHEDKEEFSRERLVSVVKAHAGDSARALVEEIAGSVLCFHRSAVLEDDLTLVVLKVHPAGTASSLAMREEVV